MFLGGETFSGGKPYLFGLYTRLEIKLFLAEYGHLYILARAVQ